MNIINLQQIQKIINLDSDLDSLIKNQKQAFIDFSNKLYEVPLPLHLHFPSHSGDCHIKAGYKQTNNIYVIKIASGVYRSTIAEGSSSDGVILVFSQKTGELLNILCDKGWLTKVRTAIAGLVAASITPWKVKNIGIIGTGSLALLLQRLVKQHYKNAQVYIWGRNPQKSTQIAQHGTFICAELKELLVQSDAIMSATASTTALIQEADISGKTHIIALGADDIHKQECDPMLFRGSDKIIVDSKIQSQKFGDTFHALQGGFIKSQQLIELGEVLQEGLQEEPELMITDLTGIAAQDVAMANFVFERLEIRS